MADEVWIKLINKKIDGDISDAELRELNHQLSQDAETRRLHDAMMAMVDSIESVADVESPAAMKESIMGAIAQQPRALRGDRSTGNWLQRWYHWWTYRPAISFASGVCAGAVLIVLLLGPGDQFRQMDEHALIGTIVFGDGPQCVPSTEEVSIDLDQVIGTIATRPTANHLVVDLSMESAGEITIELSFDRADQSFLGIKQRNAGLGKVVAAKDEIALVHSGENQYILIFDNSDGDITSIDYRILADTLLSADNLQTISCE
jgi:hypothetical protein